MIETKFRHTLQNRLKHRVGLYIDQQIAPQIDITQTVVLSGFWRSGTTWLQEALANILDAKTMFEPFHPSSRAVKVLYPDITPKNQHEYELALPYWEVDGSQTANIKPVYTQALTATLPGITQRILRKNVWEARKPRLVVKFTRAQLSLAAAATGFGFPAIHVQRDPRAIAASVVMAKSWNWLFEQLDIEKELLTPTDGRKQHFEQWSDVILSSASKPITIKVVLYWALLERFLSGQLQASQSKIQVIGYEDLLHDSASKLSTLLENLNLGKELSVKETMLQKDSFSTSGGRSNIASEERAKGWQSVLEPEIVSEIEQLTNDFGLGHTLYDN